MIVGGLPTVEWLSRPEFFEPFVKTALGYELLLRLKVNGIKPEWRNLYGTDAGQSPIERFLPHERLLAKGEQDSNPSTWRAQQWVQQLEASRRINTPGTIAIVAPVSHRLATDHVTLAHFPDKTTGAPSLSTEETLEMWKSLIELAEAYEFQIEPESPWQIRATWLDNLSASSPLAALGRNIDAYLPIELTPSAQPSPVDVARRWRRFVTEVEMLWFDHPINQKRAERGEAVMNSLWLLGLIDPSRQAADNTNLRSIDQRLLIALLQDDPWQWLETVKTISSNDLFGHHLTLTGTSDCVEIRAKPNGESLNWLARIKRVLPFQRGKANDNEAATPTRDSLGELKKLLSRPAA